MTTATALAAFLDGRALPEEEARALWQDFSEHMDEHRGDMAGFAAKRGWASVAPEYRGGQAVLVVRTTPGAPGLPPLAAAPKKPAPAGGKRPQGGGKRRPKGPPPPRGSGGAPRGGASAKGGPKR
jgi:hypothetical protein